MIEFSRKARLMTLIAGASLMLFLASALAPASANTSGWSGRPLQSGRPAVPIVNGHHVQPRRGNAPAAATDEVQQLYRELMDLTAPEKLRDLDGAPLALPAAPDEKAGWEWTGPQPHAAKVLSVSQGPPSLPRR